ncbi:hypothetical protein BKI52_19455 [marine bacterium AO1-C]|nr:hypothetical protein BKI52_19455 [marine bacterium AO1-C]
MVLSLINNQMFKSKFQNLTIKQEDVLSRNQQRMVKGGASSSTECSNGNGTISCSGGEKCTSDSVSCACYDGNDAMVSYKFCGVLSLAPA